MQNGKLHIGQLETAPWTAWWVLLVVTFLYVQAVIAHYLITMVVDVIKAELHLSDLAIGIAIGPAFAVVFAVAGLAAGRITDRYSRRLVLLGGVCAFGIGQIVGGLAESQTTLILTRILVGVGASAISPAALSLIAEKFPKGQLTTAVSVYGASSKLGVAATFAIGGIAIGWATVITAWLPDLHLAPWRVLFILVGGLEIIFGLLVFTFREASRTNKSQVDGALVLASITQFFWRERAFFLPFMVGFTLVGVSVQGLIAWVPTYMARHFQLTASYYGPVLAVIGTAAASSQMLTGGLMDFLFRRGFVDITVRFFVWLLCLTAPATVAVFLVNDLHLFIALYAIVATVTLTFGAYVLSATMIVTPPHLRGQAAAVVLFPIYAFGGLGPLIVGWFTDRVFVNEGLVGHSLALLLCIFVPASLVCLSLSLKHFRKVGDLAESRPQKMVVCHDDNIG